MPDWSNRLYLHAFAKDFWCVYFTTVRKTGKRSALAHAERLHVGLSGIHFVDTLSDAEQIHRRFGPGGVAEKTGSLFRQTQGVSSHRYRGVLWRIGGHAYHVAHERQSDCQPVLYNSMD